MKAMSHYRHGEQGRGLVQLEAGDPVGPELIAKGMQSKIPFKVKFKTKPFDSMTINYELYVSG
jgi:hypothetical protein